MKLRRCMKPVAGSLCIASSSLRSYSPASLTFAGTTTWTQGSPSNSARTSWNSSEGWWPLTTSAEACSVWPDHLPCMQATSAPLIAAWSSGSKASISGVPTTSSRVRIAEQREPGRVRIDDDAFLHQRDGVGRALDDVLELLLRLARGRERRGERAVEPVGRAARGRRRAAGAARASASRRPARQARALLRRRSRPPSRARSGPARRGAKRARKSIALARSTMPSSAKSMSISAEACVEGVAQVARVRQPGHVDRVAGIPQRLVDGLDVVLAARQGNHRDRGNWLQFRLREPRKGWPPDSNTLNSPHFATRVMLRAGVVAPVGSGYDTRPFQNHPPARYGLPRSESDVQHQHQRFPVRPQDHARRRSVLDRRERVREARQGPGVQPRAHPQPEDRARRRTHVHARANRSRRPTSSMSEMQYLYNDGEFWQFMDAGDLRAVRRGRGRGG